MFTRDFLQNQIVALAPFALEMLNATNGRIYIYVNDFTGAVFFDTYELTGSPNTRQWLTLERRQLLGIAESFDDTPIEAFHRWVGHQIESDAIRAGLIRP